jgi:hypothetical protein
LRLESCLLVAALDCVVIGIGCGLRQRRPGRGADLAAPLRLGLWSRPRLSATILQTIVDVLLEFLQLLLHALDLELRFLELAG